MLSLHDLSIYSQSLKYFIYLFIYLMFKRFDALVAKTTLVLVWANSDWDAVTEG